MDYLIEDVLLYKCYIFYLGCYDNFDCYYGLGIYC